MNMNKITLISILFLTCFSHSSQKVNFDSPEGWAMAFMTSAAQNLGQQPPYSSDIGDLSISTEISSIPHLTREQQRVGFSGFKDEDLNKSPVFGKIRLNFGLPWDLIAEISWTPPVKIDDSKPEDLWGFAISRPILDRQNILVGLRIFMLRGGAIASVTCSKDIIKFDPYSSQNPVGCLGKSGDEIQMDHDGAELFLSFKNSSNLSPWISFASSNLDNSVKINAPLELGRQILKVSSKNGTIQTFTLGLNYKINESWDMNLASSYTPHDVRRPNDISGNDNFWNFRVGVTFDW